MLKIIRKYQLIILAIGGSLLMFVFMFQPIIGKISPDPRKKAVAKLSDGTTFSGFDYQRASFDLAVLKRVYPRVFSPVEQGGLGLNLSSGNKAELHWLLLSKQANDSGLIGDSGEGRTWIPQLAEREAMSMLQQEAQQGLFTSGEEFATRQAELNSQFQSVLTRNVSLATGMMKGITEDDVYRTLATARGIQRMFGVYSSMAAFSDLGAMHSAKDRFDAVAVDAVLIKGDLFVDSFDAPTEDDLQAFFDLYKADTPSDNDYQIGYTQPTRIKMGWLTLNKQTIEATVVIDRVALNKIWRLDRNLPEAQRKYPGDFAGERVKIEGEFRATRAQNIMVEADRILRSEVLQATRGLSKEGDNFILPENWDSQRPTLEAMAQAVVDGLQEQLGASTPLPSVDIITDRWLNTNDITSLQGFGKASYRVGSRAFPAAGLPLAVYSDEIAALMPFQPRVPIVSPAAEDELGNRYYAIIYEVNDEGPADSIDDAGRDKVLADYRTVKAFEMLSSNLDSISAPAKAANDLAPAVDAALALGRSGLNRPGVARNLLVRQENIERGRIASMVEPGFNTQEFRDAILEAASGLYKLATPDQVAQSPIIVAVALPSSKGIGIAKVIAPRPMTMDQFTSQMSQVLSYEARAQLSQSMEGTTNSPFSLVAMTDRYGFEEIKKGKKNEADEAVEADSESAES